MVVIAVDATGDVDAAADIDGFARVRSGFALRFRVGVAVASCGGSELAGAIGPRTSALGALYGFGTAVLTGADSGSRS